MSMENQLRSIDGRLREIGVAQVGLIQQQDKIRERIGEVATAQDQTHTALQALRHEFDKYVRHSELARNRQLAQTEIIAVRQELETDYGHFGEVRRLATGTLQALDVGIVSNGTMRQLSEELMLTTPRYWLAPALVAIAAWIRDDEQLAQRALGEAVRRDNDKASLFFALVLRRHQRNMATARWLRQYVARQDPAALSREFTVILDAVATGALGHEAKPLVLEQLGEWYGRLNADQEVVDLQVQRWQQSLDLMRRPTDPRYQVLPEISPTWSQLKELYEGATVHGVSASYFQKMFTGPVPHSDDLRWRVDDILAGLVKNYDVEEAPLRRREAQLDAIIRAEGDKDKAATLMAAEDSVHEPTIDFLTLISNAAMHAEKAGASPGTRRFAVALAKDWIVQASGRLEARNLAAMPPVVELSMEGWTGKIDGSTGEPQLVEQLAAHVDRETERAVAQVRFIGPLSAAICAGIALVIALIAAVSGDMGLAVFLLIVAGAAGGWSAYRARALPARRAELRAQGEQRKAAVVARLRGGIAELVDLRADWERERAKAESLRQYMEQLNRDAFVAAAPDQLRGA